MDFELRLDTLPSLNAEYCSSAHFAHPKRHACTLISRLTMLNEVIEQLEGADWQARNHNVEREKEVRKLEGRRKERLYVYSPEIMGNKNMMHSFIPQIVSSSDK